MDNINQNKLNEFRKFNVSVEVTKAKDVLDKDSVKAKDVLANKTGEDNLINKMSDIFPQTQQHNDDMLS